MSGRRTAILEKMRALGIEPKRSLGQNFLVADHVIEKILAAARAAPAAMVLEIGPGLGALTEGLLTDARPFAVIELDRTFAGHWRSREVRVVEADALALDWATLRLPPDTLLVSNLPYQISSSLVIDRSVDPAGLTQMILMFQKEVAQRLLARAHTKEYGLLTVIAQTFWEIRFLCEAGPGDFYPPPNVASRVLTFRRRADVALEDPGKFLRFVKAAFAHRRKLLTKNLPGVEAALRELGLPGQARAEELDPQQFLSLYQLRRDGSGAL